ncbi:MAG: hypothetical protein ACTIMQ_09855 [Acinetobacter guillouiae]
MKKLKIADLNLLSDELYLQAIMILHLDKYKRKSQKSDERGDQKIKQSLGLTAEEKRKLLKDLGNLGDLSFNVSLWKNSPFEGDEDIVNFAFSKDYTASKNLILIKKISHFIENYTQLDAYSIQKCYRSTLDTLIEMLTPRKSMHYSLIYFLEFRKKIQGYIAAKQRHGIKQSIFFDILIDRAEKNGKWNSPTQAVQDVYDEVTAEFEKIDEQYIEQQLKSAEYKKQIVITEKEELERVVESISARTGSMTQGGRDAENLNWALKRQRELNIDLQAIESQISQYTDVKKQGYPFESLGRQILFNIDIELSLINCLKNNKEVVSQVIAKRERLKSKD